MLALEPYDLDLRHSNSTIPQLDLTRVTRVTRVTYCLYPSPRKTTGIWGDWYTTCKYPTNGVYTLM